MLGKSLGAVLRAAGFLALVVGVFGAFIEAGSEGLKAALTPALAAAAGLAAVWLGSWLKGPEPEAPAPADASSPAGAKTVPLRQPAHWGAFFLTWIWAFGHGLWAEGLAALLWIGAVGWLRLGLLFALPPSLVFGWKGYAWARRARPPADEARFRLVERRWTQAGLCFFVGCLVLGAVRNRLEARREAELERGLAQLHELSERHEAWDRPENLPNAQAQTKAELREVRLLGGKDKGWVVGGRVYNVGKTRTAPLWVDCEIRDGSGLAVVSSTSSDIPALDPGEDYAVFCDWTALKQDLPPDREAYAVIRPFGAASGLPDAPKK